MICCLYVSDSREGSAARTTPSSRAGNDPLTVPPLQHYSTGHQRFGLSVYIPGHAALGIRNVRSETIQQIFRNRCIGPLLDSILWQCVIQSGAVSADLRPLVHSLIQAAHQYSMVTPWNHDHHAGGTLALIARGALSHRGRWRIELASRPNCA